MIVFFWSTIWLFIPIMEANTLFVEIPHPIANDENKNFVKLVNQRILEQPKDPDPSTFNPIDIISDVTDLSIRKTSPNVLKSTTLLQSVKADARRKNKVPHVPFTNKKSNTSNQTRQRRSRWEIADSRSSSSSDESSPALIPMLNFVNNKKTKDNSSSTSSNSARKSAEKAMDLYNDWDN